MRLLLSLCLLLPLLSGCINHANNAKKAADVVVAVHVDWLENTETFLTQSQEFCQNPNPLHLEGLQQSQQLFANIVSRLEGFELLFGRGQLMPIRVFLSPDEMSELVEGYLNALKSDPSLSTREHDPRLNSVNALEYLLRAQGERFLQEPEPCQALLHILEGHKQQADTLAQRVERTAPRQLQDMANRDPEAYYRLIADIIRSQLATSLRWAHLPFDEQLAFHQQQSLAPWSDNTHFHIIQPMETARILFIVAGPQNLMRTKREADLASEIRDGLDEVFGMMIPFDNYNDMTHDDNMRAQMLQAIDKLAAFDAKLRQPEVRRLIESVD